jgi:nucleoside-diphosphate-sugar epimerase
MKVLVTGGNGFLGSHVIDVLAPQGHELRLLLRATSDTAFIRGQTYERADGDMRRPEALEAAVRGVDAVVHCAGLTTARNEGEFRAVNDEGRECLPGGGPRGRQALRVFLSLAAQGPSPDGQFWDAMEVPPRPHSPYGRSKLAGEEHVTALRDEMSVVSIRSPVIYGPRDRALLPFFRLAKYRVMPMYGDGQNQISLIHAKDAANAISCCLAASGPSGAIYTISDGGRHTWMKLASMLGAALGKQPLKLRVPGAMFEVAGWGGSLAGAVLRKPMPLQRHRVHEFGQQFWVCGHDRITRDLGWKPAYLPDEGLRETVAWYREQGWL